MEATDKLCVLIKRVAKVRLVGLKFSIPIIITNIAIKNALGQRQRTDLPDNGLRFLPEDLERVIPTSIPLKNDSIDDEGGNSKALIVNFSLFMLLFAAFVLVLYLQTWRRRKADKKLFQDALESTQRQSILSNWSKNAEAQMAENSRVSDKWVSISIPPEPFNTSATNEGDLEGCFLEQPQHQEQTSMPEIVDCGKMGSSTAGTPHIALGEQAWLRSAIPEKFLDSNHPDIQNQASPLACYAKIGSASINCKKKSNVAGKGLGSTEN
ncbi:hypothetical protein O181_009773 [Austropuccinia psidii MF-1]|uniref:Uncharacterized protein n=1 Tax=Austropuccinia psidii MF-1 TaxID=1389203 RepID=A0A9Q3BRP4_9BASI|nr:hypothetical protein [Austropuccinia psidii MF-1]